MWLEDCFLSWWLHGPRYGWSKFRRFLFERGFLKTELPKVETLNDIQQSLQQVTWKQDGFAELFDCVSYPQRVWARKKDDCDGFAILAAALLKQLKTPTNPVIVTAMVNSINNCHSVCAFEWEGHYRYFSNAELSVKNFSNYEAIVKDYVGTKYRLLCWDVVDPVTLKELDYQPAKHS
jgi:hypothetical protein